MDNQNQNPEPQYESQQAYQPPQPPAQAPVQPPVQAPVQPPAQVSGQPMAPPPPPPAFSQQPLNGAAPQYQAEPWQQPGNDPEQAAALKRLVVLAAVVLVAGAAIWWLVMVALPHRYRTLPSPQTTSPVSSAFTPTYVQVQREARNTERKVDLSSMQSTLENFYNNYQYYPTLAQLNDDNFWKTYLPNADRAASQDPLGDTNQFAASLTSPKQWQYAYTPGPNGCDNKQTMCTGYSLDANMEDGQPALTKISLH